MSLVPACTIKSSDLFSKKSSSLSKMASLVAPGILFTLTLWFFDKPFSWIPFSSESPTIIIFLFSNCSFVSSAWVFKGYLRYKTILCHKVALDVQLMNIFIWRKKNISFSRYREFYVFAKFPDFKICDVIISITG